MINNNVRVAIWGFGAMGSGMAKMLLKKQGVDIVGVCDMHPDRLGKNMFEVLGIPQNSKKSVIISSDINDIIYENSCDIALLATDSFTKNAFDKINLCLENKINVISTAEEMAYPQAQNPELAKELEKKATENGVTVLGTGINPGFVLDYLILALTGTCEEVESIKAARINDLSPFGHAVMEEQGVGITKQEFEERVEKDDLAGHVGFPESIQMIADGLGIPLDKIEQTKDPIISNTTRQTQYAKVEPGNLAGIRQRGFGYSNGKLVIEMDHPQQILPETEDISTGDYINIKGLANINLQINPEIPGGIGTIAMCVNMIPHVINSEAGLKTMLDLPVPRAIMGDMRNFIKKG